MGDKGLYVWYILLYSTLVFFMHPMRLSALININTKASYVLVLKFNSL